MKNKTLTTTNINTDTNATNSSGGSGDYCTITVIPTQYAPEYMRTTDEEFESMIEKSHPPIQHLTYVSVCICMCVSVYNIQRTTNNNNFFIAGDVFSNTMFF